MSVSKGLKIRNKIFFILALLYSGLIFYLSSLSRPVPELQFLFSYDKVIHCVEYGIFAFLWWFGLQNFIRDKVLLNRVVFIWGIVYGVSDEIHQSFVPGRVCSIFDIIADIIGILIFILIIRYYDKKNNS